MNSKISSLGALGLKEKNKFIPNRPQTHLRATETKITWQKTQITEKPNEC